MWSKVSCSRLWSRVLISGALLGGCTLLSLLAWSKPGAHAVAPATIEVDGQRLASDDSLAQRARHIAADFLRAPFTLHVGDQALQAPRAALGAAVDVPHLRRLLEDGANPMSAMRRLHDHLHRGQPLLLPIPMALEDSKAVPFIERLKDLVDRAPVDARVDPRKRTVVPARPGQELDVIATLVQMELAMRDGKRSVAAVVRALRPQRTEDAFEGVDMSAELAVFETPYNRADVAADRTHNLRITAKKIDGRVIPAGGIFDFNAVVGDRTRANGYRNATVIAGGELVEGMGGGTCQVASTLHAAVLFAGLPIVTRNPHSRPSFYIKLGLDAAVAYGSLNFRFRNDFETPIVIDATLQNGQMRVALRGAQQNRSVTFIREVTKALPFDEELVNDDTLPTGLRVLRQRGVPGFEVKRQRIIKDEASGAETRDENADLYPPTTQIWVVGQGPEGGPDFVPPENDGHPEYVVDEFLTAVRSAASSEINVSAKPGRFGSYGWTLREGMAKNQQPDE